MMRKIILMAFIVCCASFIFYAQPPDAQAGEFTVFIDKDFTKIFNVTGFNWNPSSNVTLEIDSGADGSVDYQQTITVPIDGTADFDLGGTEIPVAEGDRIRMIDDLSPTSEHIHYVHYLTLDAVNPISDTLAGRARDGNIINAMVFYDPSIPSGPDLNVEADENDEWSADFSAMIDIVNGSSGWTWIQDEDFDKTQINWTVEEIFISFDIKPGSCPNPINIKSKGVLPAAIMGTEDFDVTTLDPASLRLRLKGSENDQVAPLQWALADIGEPFYPFIGKEYCYEDCVDCSCADGAVDLVFHFDTQDVVNALGEVYDRDCILLEITGVLKEEFGDTTIVGEDVVLILSKDKNN